MDKAILDGEIYDAVTVAGVYELEKKIRVASKNRRLRCPDPQCKYPCMKYCHGEKNNPYFGHIDGDECEYFDYDTRTPSALKLIKRLAYNSFRRRGYNVEMDVKLLPHHYSHLVFSFGDRKVALELANRNTSADKLVSISEQYGEINVGLAWLVVGYPEEEIDEKNAFFAKRFMLNEDGVNDLIIIDEEGTRLSQYRPDVTEYKYKGETFRSENYPTVIKTDFELDELVINEGGYFGFSGFRELFDRMLEKKRRAFDKLVESKQRAEQEAMKREAEMQAEMEARNRLKALEVAEEANKITVKKVGDFDHITVPQSKLHTEEAAEVLSAMLVKEKLFVFNSDRQRLYMCRNCHRVDTEAGFANCRLYVSEKTYYSLGICRGCAGI